MKDIPVFSTEYGIASLGLRQIPYTARAYVHIRCAQDPQKLLEECVGFCRAAGAESVFAEGEGLEGYPLHTEIVEMQCVKENIPVSDASVFPVTEKTLELWIDTYNQAMQSVPNAAWMSEKDGLEMLAAGEGYFVHREKMLLGIGKVRAGRVDAIAALVPGRGETVMQALCEIVQEDTVTLEVATANERAMRLYQRMSFLQASRKERWYRIL